jgi:hypothetical protein
VARDYVDDPTILDSERLWRRIHPKWVVPDGNTGALRLSSAAFSNSSDGSPMSIVLAGVAATRGRGPESIIVGHLGFSVAAIAAGFARSLGQSVLRDPQPEEPARGLVAGDKPKAIRRKMASEAQWVIPPPGVTS